MSVEHIEIADTTEPGPEPFELPTQAVDPTRIEERATGSEDGPGSADRHSHLVDVLGIASAAGACLVGVNGVDLPLHRRDNVIEGGIGRHARLRLRPILSSHCRVGYKALELDVHLVATVMVRPGKLEYAGGSRRRAELLSWLAHFIERHPGLHRRLLAVWKHFPPRLAGFLRGLLTTRWAVGAVAVILDEEVDPPEVLLVEHSYRTKGAWGLPGGSLESGLRNPREASMEEARDDIIESSLRREVFEELGIEIEILRLIKIDAVPYVPEEPGPYRLDFYYRCLPKQGFGSLREGLGRGNIKPRSPEVRQISLVPLSRLKEYDLYSSDARILYPLVT